MVEHLKKATPLELYNQLIVYEPKPIARFVPADAKQQRDAFMSGEIHSPHHDYDRLDKIDFTQSTEKIIEIGEDIRTNPGLNPKYLSVYEQFVDKYIKRTDFMRTARDYNKATGDIEKAEYATRFMDLNKELYGEPDETIYRSLLQEKLDAIAMKQLSPEHGVLRNQLFSMIDYNPGLSEATDRFRPSSETVQWVQGIAETLYNGMLSHVPDQESFSVDEIKEVFTTIITQEFGEAAKGWQVDIEPAKSINVKCTEMRVVIPEGRKDLSWSDLRKMVVHELGIHMLRSIIGEDTDLTLLKSGLSEYYDSEEGLGVVMQQAIEGKFKEAGVDHYITAGLAYYDTKDFREIYDIQWRILALIKSDISDEVIEKSKDTAYEKTMRSLRGTDNLPWFKDLAYYNGAIGVWKHLEKIKGDDLLFSLVLLGKVDPTNIDHQRVVLETRST